MILSEIWTILGSWAFLPKSPAMFLTFFLHHSKGCFPRSRLRWPSPQRLNVDVFFPA
jgi:hypothetical protein